MAGVNGDILIRSLLLEAVLLVPAYGNHGLWAALVISFAARGITLGLRYPALESDADRAADRAVA